MNSNEILASAYGCLHDIDMSYGLGTGLFIAGLVGGATHCVAMCGPFVLAQTGRVEKISQAVLLPYHMGRITTYVSLAFLVSAVLNTAFLYLPIRTYIIIPILMTAGVIFLVNAFPALKSLFPWANEGVTFIPYRWLSSLFTQLTTSSNNLQKYLTGVLLGFMPCGLVLAALMTAATAPSAIESASVMALFGLGTMPALISAAFGGAFLKIRFPSAMRRVTQGLMVWSSLWLFLLAGMLLME